MNLGKSRVITPKEHRAMGFGESKPADPIPMVRVRALREGVICGTRVLAIGEIGETPSDRASVLVADGEVTYASDPPPSLLQRITGHR